MRPRPTRTPAALKLEVIVRHVYHITDGELVTQTRQALRADDFERLDELITYLDDADGIVSTCDVLECQEIRRSAGALKGNCR